MKSFNVNAAISLSSSTSRPSGSLPSRSPAVNGRKRSRSRLGTFAPASVFIVVASAVAVFSSTKMFIPFASGFSVSSPSTSTAFQARRRELSQLYVSQMEVRPLASASSSGTLTKRRPRTTIKRDGYSNTGDGRALATRVKPKMTISDEKRQKVLKAMQAKNQRRTTVETALQGVDAQVLELLSEHFLYPETITASVEATKMRPKGRPESVMGAMNYDTMLKYRERQDLIRMVGNMDPATYATPPAELLGAREAPLSPSSQASMMQKRKGIKGASTTNDKAETIAVVDNNETEEAAPKRRKRVVKSLPEPRSKTDKGRNGKTVRPSKGNSIDLHKYYRTELLSSDEEYSLGMKTLFMMKAEQVHEGLSLSLMRLPTIQEWAQACGFTEDDPNYIPMEGDEQIRPAGSETMFEDVDPNTFVGNGLAQEAGPGRGRGRAKKPPPTKLKDFYDDSELKASGNDSKKDRKRLEPINRGTVSKFIEMMFSAKEAKQRMIQCNMRLVLSIARKYSNVGVSLQDLVQEGSLGLSRAAEKFEPAKGFKFSTYASWWIQQAVFRSIAYHSRTIRLPVHIHNLLNRIRKIRNSLERELGRPPTNEEMAMNLEMSVEKYNKMLRLTKRSISLEVPKYQSNPKDLGHESEDLLGDTIDTSSVIFDESSPEKRVDRGLFEDDLKEMLEILDEDERRVIYARYGLADGLTRTVTAVAAQMRMSKAWVRSQECRALRKLRRPWYEKKLKEHEDALMNY